MRSSSLEPSFLGSIVARYSRVGYLQHVLAARRFLVVGLPKLFHAKDDAHDRFHDTGIDKTGNFNQLLPVWFDDEERVAHSRLAQPFGISRDGHQLTALSKDTPRTVSRVSSDRIEHHIHVSDDRLERRGPVIDDFVGAERLDKVGIRR